MNGTPASQISKHYLCRCSASVEKWCKVTGSYCHTDCTRWGITDMQSNLGSLKCKEAIKRGLHPAGTFCPKCPKKSGDCLFKIGLWTPNFGSTASCSNETSPEPVLQASNAC